LTEFATVSTVAPVLRGRRIVVLAPEEPPVGGVSRYGLCLRRVLQLAGATIRPMTLEGLAGGGSPDTLGTREWLVLQSAGPEALVARRMCRSAEVAAVIDNFQFFWRNSRYAWVVTRGTRAPYILVIHHGRFPRIAAALRGVGRRVIRHALERTAGVICMSEPIIRAVRELAPATNVELLTPWLPPSPDPSASRPAASPHGGLGRYVCTSGALAAVYGTDEVVAGFRRLAAKDEDLTLVLLVGSFLREESAICSVEALRADVGENRVVVLEDHPDGPAIISGAAVYVRASRSDSFGLGIHEAMSAGVPVVATRHPTRPAGAILYDAGDIDALVDSIRGALRPKAQLDARAAAGVVASAARANTAQTIEFIRSAL